MARLLHGAVINVNTVEVAGAVLASRDAAFGRLFGRAPMPDLQAFDFLFPQLQADPANLLPEGAGTVAALTRVRRIVLTDYLSGVKMLDLEASVADEPAKSPVAAEAATPAHV